MLNVPLPQVSDKEILGLVKDDIMHPARIPLLIERKPVNRA
jgi:hypothetical protein